MKNYQKYLKTLCLVIFFLGFAEGDDIVDSTIKIDDSTTQIVNSATQIVNSTIEIVNSTTQVINSTTQIVNSTQQIINSTTQFVNLTMSIPASNQTSTVTSSQPKNDALFNTGT